MSCEKIPLTLEDAEKIRDKAEKEAARLLILAGLHVFPGRSIRSKHPVANKNGDIKKTVHHPEFYVEDPATGWFKHVEVTNGNGILPSKQAQARVVKAAGLGARYCVFDADIRLRLHRAEEEGKLQKAARKVLGWD